MNITCLHPSRNRAVMACAAFTDWMTNASGKHHIEWIVSIDEDDQQVDEYNLRFKPFGIKIIQNRNRSLVDAVNNAAKVAHQDTELFIVVSDDFGCPKDWDELICQALPDFQMAAVQIDDGISYGKPSPDNRLLTLPIITYDLYEVLGYVYHPAYFSMFVDNDLYEVCDRMQVLVDAGHLKFPHSHWVNGLRDKDSTYQRQNSAIAYQMGKATFENRKSAGFP